MYNYIGRAAVFSGPSAVLSFFVGSDGNLYGNGVNDHGQLGLGDKEDRSSPEPLEFFRDKTVLDVACGYEHSLVLVEGGDVFGFGRYSDGQLGFLSEDASDVLSPLLVPPFLPPYVLVVAIACGEYASYCLDSDGNVWSFGRNREGELGIGTKTRQQHPTKVKFVESERSVDGSHLSAVKIRIKSISAGTAFAIALSEEGRIYSWGWNCDGQLGRDGDGLVGQVVTLDSRSSHYCQGVGREDKERVIKVYKATCGADFVVALVRNEGYALNAIYVWGSNQSGTLGIGSDERCFKTPMRMNLEDIEGVQDIHGVAVGGSHMFLISKPTSGDDSSTRTKLFSIGYNGFCALLHENDDAYSEIRSPIEVTPESLNDILQVGGEDIEDVVCGGSHSLFVTTSGNCFGCGVHSALGQPKLSRHPVLMMAEVAFLGNVSVISRRLFQHSLRLQSTMNALDAHNELKGKGKWEDHIVFEVLDAKGDVLKVWADTEFIKARFGHLVRRTSLKGGIPLSELNEVDILQQIYGGIYPDSVLGERNSIEEAMNILFTEREKTGDILISGAGSSPENEFEESIDLSKERSREIWRDGSCRSNSHLHVHKAHRFVLMAMRDYFYAMFREERGDRALDGLPDGFSGWIESSTGEVSLSIPIGYESFEAYLRYLYFGKLNPTSREEAEDVLKCIDYFDEATEEDKRVRKICEKLKEIP